jgi:hypothetical protein
VRREVDLVDLLQGGLHVKASADQHELRSSSAAWAQAFGLRSSAQMFIDLRCRIFGWADLYL